MWEIWDTSRRRETLVEPQTKVIEAQVVDYVVVVLATDLETTLDIDLGDYFLGMT